MPPSDQSSCSLTCPLHGLGSCPACLLMESDSGQKAGGVRDDPRDRRLAGRLGASGMTLGPAGPGCCSPTALGSGLNRVSPNPVPENLIWKQVHICNVVSSEEADWLGCPRSAAGSTWSQTHRVELSDHRGRDQGPAAGNQGSQCQGLAGAGRTLPRASGGNTGTPGLQAVTESVSVV